MNALLWPSDFAPPIEFFAYCDTCGGRPCIYPPFCKVCRAADQRRAETLKARQWLRDATVTNEYLKWFAARAAELAGQWRSGTIDKLDAVDRAYNFAIALGLHYRLDKAERRHNSRAPHPTSEDRIQRILSAAFAQ